MTNLIDLLDGEPSVRMLVLFVPKVAAAVVILVVFWIIRRVTRTPVKLALRSARFDEALVG